MKKKGIVLEKRNDTVTLLLEGGEFANSPKGKYPKAQVGDEVTINQRTNKGLYLLPLVASLIFFIGLSQVFGAANKVYGYVTLDVNPSMELSLNRRDHVLNIEPFNLEAESLLSQGEFKGLELDVALSQIIALLTNNGHISDDTDIIISTVSLKENNALQFEQEVGKAVSKAIQTNNIPVKAHVIVASKDDRDSGKVQGLSTGKQVVREVIQSRGMEVDKEAIRGNGINKTIKEKGIEVEEVVEEARARSKQNNSSVNTNNNRNPNNNENPGNSGNKPNINNPSNNRPGNGNDGNNNNNNGNNQNNRPGNSQNSNSGKGNNGRGR